MSIENKIFANKRIVLIVFFMNVVVLIAILITVIVAVPDLSDFINTKQVCLPSQEGSSLVCGSPQDILPEYLTERLDNAYEKLKKKKEKEDNEMSIELKHYLYKIYFAAKPAARYSANIKAEIPEKQGSSKQMTPITVWNHGNDDKYGFQRFGVRYEDGRIIVPVSGTYLVYSFLDMYEEWKSNETYSKRDGPIKHSIYAFNFTERVEKELVTSCHLQQYPSSRRFNIYSSFVMTLVDLWAGDDVRVKVNDLSLLRYPVFNTFGMNLV